MQFEWDEAKRLSNIAKHRIDFLRVRDVFDGRPQMSEDSPRAGERRTLTVAELDDDMLTVVWTARADGTIRIISARRSRGGEERKYRALFG